MSKIAERMAMLKEEDARQSALMGCVIVLNNRLARGEITKEEFIEKFERFKEYTKSPAYLQAKAGSP